MAELIATGILIISIVGMSIIVFRKIPRLLTLPETFQEKKEGIISRLGGKLKESGPFKNFSYEIFLQKIISKIRILTLKMDVKTWSWLQKLRERTRKKKLGDDNYWEELKKSTDKKDKELPK